MTAFAVRTSVASLSQLADAPYCVQTGGLLSDVFLHLVPHSFTGEAPADGTARFMLVEEKRNILIGCGLDFPLPLLQRARVDAK